jgi:hypothetical protein
MWIFCITRDAKTAATVPKADNRGLRRSVSRLTNGLTALQHPPAATR